MTTPGRDWGHLTRTPPPQVRARRHLTPQSVKAVVTGIIDPRRVTYRGIRMRSLLETAFARHLDELGIEWRYEPGVFGPRGRGYLPDFQVVRPDGYHFIEVKPTYREVELAQRRMAVIWEAHPTAVLVIACAEGCQWFASTGAGQPWETWTDRWSPA